MCVFFGICLIKYVLKVFKKFCVFLNFLCSEFVLEIVLVMELGWKWFKKDKFDIDEILYFVFENIMKLEIYLLVLMILREKFFDLFFVMINIVIIFVDYLYY